MSETQRFRIMAMPFTTTTSSHISKVKVLQEESVWRIHGFSSTFPNIFQPGGLTLLERFKLIDFRHVSSVFNMETRVGDNVQRMSAEVALCCDWVMANERQVRPHAAIELTSFLDLKGTRANQFREGEIKPTIYLLSVEGHPLYQRGHKTEFWHSPSGNEFFDSDCTFQFEMPEFQELWQKSHLYFPDDILRIKFEITFVKSDIREIQLNVSPSSLASLSNDLLKMLRNGDRADFEIKCEDKRFAVHELVLSARSPVFSRMLSTPMLEKHSRTLVVTDVAPAVLELLLKYMYGSDLNFEELGIEKTCDVAKVAHKYQVNSLVELCFSFLSTSIRLDMAPMIAMLAHQLSPAKRIRDKIFDFCSQNFHELRHVHGFEEVVKHCADAWFD